jgi:protoporphyrinogen oxidase
MNATQKRIAIIGGGITGLTAAYDLLRQPGQRFEITIYEAGAQLGGLAAGFKGKASWEWPLEYFYHHLFTNDDAILSLTRALGMDDLLAVHSPTTVLHSQGNDYPLDSALRLLQFPRISLWQRLRVGMVLAYLKYHPKPPWQHFDKILADQWLARWMGERGYEVIWRPMLEGKFGPHFNEVNLAWFWARVYKRTPQLIYYRGGFQAFVEGLATALRTNGVIMHTGTAVEQVEQMPGGKYRVTVAGQETAPFDVVLSTVSPGLMQRLTPTLPATYLSQLAQLKSMGAVVVTLALNQQLMTNGAYWVNLPKREGFPFLALVEHTNMVSPTHYGGDHLLYLGDYLDPGHRYFAMSVDELLDEFTPHLRKFNPGFERSWITGAWVHKASYAQPVPPVGYLEMIPDLRTPLAGLYFASMSQVYPWDRGTNYAVELGHKVAAMMLEDQG